MTTPVSSKKKYCECENPKRCNNGTGMIGWIGGKVSKNGLPIGKCNLCHKCSGLIDKRFDVVYDYEE